jgi:hypothetical protein
MGMIDSQKLFTALSHLSLSCEEFFRRGFIRYLGIAGDIAQRMYGCGAIVKAPDQTTALERRGLSRMCKDFLKLCILKGDHSREIIRPSRL